MGVLKSGNRIVGTGEVDRVVYRVVRESVGDRMIRDIDRVGAAAVIESLPPPVLLQSA